MGVKNPVFASMARSIWRQIRCRGASGTEGAGTLPGEFGAFVLLRVSSVSSVRSHRVALLALLAPPCSQSHAVPVVFRSIKNIGSPKVAMVSMARTSKVAQVAKLQLF